MLGVALTVWPTPPQLRAPPQEALLRALQQAPVAAGARVVLIVPPEQVVPLFYEACWQRPDLRWSTAPFPPASGLAVVLDDEEPPAGLQELWRSGRLRLWAAVR